MSTRDASIGGVVGAVCKTIDGATDGSNHLNYCGTDHHYIPCEDDVSPWETGPKRPCILTLRLCTPLNGDEEELNEVGSKPHEESPLDHCVKGTELAAISLYPETFSYSVKTGGPINCKAADRPACPVIMATECHKDSAIHRSIPNEADN